MGSELEELEGIHMKKQMNPAQMMPNPRIRTTIVIVAFSSWACVAVLPCCRGWLASTTA